MKSKWQTEPFEDCIGKVTYTQKVQRQDFLDDGAYPIISQEVDFINGYWDNETDLFKVRTPVVVFGDHTKVLKYIDFDFVLGADGVKVLQPRDFLLPKFFFYQLQTANLDSLGYARHYKLLKELEIAYPSLPEQQRIVAILDEAFAAIAKAKENAEKNLQNTRKLFESYLESIFANPGEGWEEKRLGELCDISHGYSFESRDFGTDFKGDSPIVLTPGNFLENCKLNFNEKNTKRCIGKYPEEFTFNIGDLVIVMTDLSPKMKILGKPAFIEDANILHNQRIGRFKFYGNALDKFYLFYYLQTKLYLNNIKKTATGTMVRHTAPKRILMNMIAFPSLPEQQRVVAKLDALSTETKKLEIIYQRKIANLEELKRSILQKAFAGEL